MGLRARYIGYIDSYVNKEFGDIKGLSMLELGNQVFRKSDRDKFKKTGKEYFESIGVKHTSIDLNGKNGALKLDLSKPIHEEGFINNFNIITNFGTTEHIEPLENQYECFKNIHNFMSIGGISIHLVPDAYGFESRDLFRKKHCNHFYSGDFFRMLAESSSYELIETRRIKSQRIACVKKVIDEPFMLDKNLFLSKILRREDGKIYNYNKGDFNYG